MSNPLSPVSSPGPNAEPDLVGRDDELSALIAATGVHRSVRIDAPPGGGKSALLRTFARRRAGALYVDVQGTKTLFNTVLDIKDHLGLAEVPDNDLDTSLTRIAAACVSRAVSVFILDGLNRRAEGVLVALARHAPDLTVVFCGDERLRAAHNIPLSPLSNADSMSLMCTSAGIGEDGLNDEVLAKLVETAHGHPLALQIVGTKIQVNGLPAVRRALDTVTPTTIGSKTAAALVWATLSPTERADLDRLRIFNGPFTLESAERTLAPSDDWAVDALQGLKRFGLVVTKPAPRADVRFFLPLGVRHIVAQQMPVGDATFTSHARALCAHFGRSRASWRADSTVARARFAAERSHIVTTFLHPSAQPEERAHAALTLAAHAHWHGPMHEGARGLTDIDTSVLDADLARRVLVARAALYFRAGRIEDAAAAATMLEGHEDHLAVQIVHAELAAATERWSDAEAGFRLAIATWRETRPHRQLTATRWLLDAAARGEAVDDAEALARDIWSNSDDPLVLGEAWHAVGRIRLARQGFEAARYALDHADEALRPLSTPLADSVSVERALCDLMCGAHREARVRLVATLGAAEHNANHNLYVRAATWLSVCSLFAGRVSEATALAHDATHTPLGRGRPGQRALALAESVSALCLGLGGELAQARRSLEKATTAAHGRGRARRVIAIVEAGLQALASETPVPPSPDAHDDAYVHLMRDLVTRLCAPQTEQNCLVIGEQARSMRLTSGQSVDLSRRGPLRLLLLALAQAHTQAPDTCLSVDDLITAGWPEQRILPEAAPARVYAAIRTLRRLGLDEILLTKDDGYLLDPQIRVVVRS